jgi:hypothetical protein
MNKVFSKGNKANVRSSATTKEKNVVAEITQAIGLEYTGKNVKGSDGFDWHEVKLLNGSLGYCRADVSIIIPSSVKPKIFTTAEMISRYGQPNATGEGYLTTINLPYPMRIAWDMKKTVSRMACHRLVADRFLAVFNDLLAHYGLAKIQELGIDIFGGCFNYRQMRGGTELSIHSWACAIDLDPDRNALKTKFSNSQFAKPEYSKMHEIFEKHGFINLGKAKGFDSMHFQIAV